LQNGTKWLIHANTSYYYINANEPQTLRDEYSQDTKILDAEYKPASLDDVIKTCKKLQLEEKHQLKMFLQKYELLLIEHYKNPTKYPWPAAN
jgi:hypothetical protein